MIDFSLQEARNLAAADPERAKDLAASLLASLVEASGDTLGGMAARLIERADDLDTSGHVNFRANR